MNLYPPYDVKIKGKNNEYLINKEIINAYFNGQDTKEIEVNTESDEDLFVYLQNCCYHFAPFIRENDKKINIPDNKHYEGLLTLSDRYNNSPIRQHCIEYYMNYQNPITQFKIGNKFKESSMMKKAYEKIIDSSPEQQSIWIRESGSDDSTWKWTEFFDNNPEYRSLWDKKLENDSKQLYLALKKTQDSTEENLKLKDELKQIKYELKQLKDVIKGRKKSDDDELLESDQENDSDEDFKKDKKGEKKEDNKADKVDKLKKKIDGDEYTEKNKHKDLKDPKDIRNDKKKKRDEK